MTIFGAYAKISRPVPRSKFPGKFVVSRPNTPESNAWRKPSFEPTTITLRRFAFRWANVRYGSPVVEELVRGVRFADRYWKYRGGSTRNGSEWKMSPSLCA